MANNDKVRIFDEENIKINVYEENRTDVHLINENPSIEIVRIYEPGPQGPKGNDGGEFILPDNVVSSSNQISSDISGSFTSVSESLSQRINFFENKSLISGSDQLSSVFELRGNNIVSASSQLTGSYDLRYELRGSGILSSSNGFISSSQQVKDNLPDGTVSSSNQLSSVFESKGSNLLSSSQQISTEISGAFGQASSSFQSRVSTIESKTLVSGSQQIKNLLPTDVISGSEQVTSSLDVRYHRLGTGLFSSSQQVTYGQLSNIPTGILSSSNGFLSASSQVDFVGIINKPTLFSGSTQVNYSQLQNIPAGIASGSQQFTSSYDSRYELRGSGILSSSNGFISASSQVDYNSIQNKPTTIPTASYALTASYVSGSSNSSISSSYSVSSSYALYALSASYVPGTTLPSNLISSSQQVNFADISGSFNTGSFLPNSFTASYNIFTSSIDTKVQHLENATSSYAIKTEISGAFANVSSSLASRIGTVESKTLISSSNQISYPQLLNIPAGILSSSAGFISSSQQVDFNNISNKPGLFSGSAQVVFSGISNVPSGLLSSSQQINLLLPNLVSGSDQLSGSYDVRYERKGSNLVSSSLQLASDISGSVTSKIEPLNTFSGSIQTRVQRLEQVTSSLFSFTSSANTRLDRIESVTASYNTFTASISTLVNRLESATGSYALKTEVSGAFTNVSSSFQNRIGVIEGKTLFSSSAQLPSGLISSSAGFFSSSAQVDFAGIINKPTLLSGSSQVIYNQIGSIPSNIVSGSEQLTSSYDTRYHRLGTGLVSSSNQLASDISGSVTSKIEPLNVFSGSTNQRIDRLENITGSLFSFTSSVNTLINRLELNTGSYAIKTEVSGAFGNVSSSFQARISTFENKTLVSGSAQVDYNSIQNQPTTIPSASYAITASYALNGGGGGPSISASYAETASYLNNQARYFAYHNQGMQDVTWSFQHNLGNQFPVVTVWNTDNEVVIPEKIYAPTTNLTYIYFPTSQSGFVAATIGSILPTGSNGNFSGSFSGSFFGDGSGLTGIVPTLPANLFSGSSQVIFSGISNVPANLVSGSDQISSSYDLKYERKGTGIVSASSQINYSGLAGVPSGILSSSNGFISSSAQIASDISGSFVSLSGSFANRIYSNEQITGSILNRLIQLELTSGSLNTFTGSIQSEVNNLKIATGSLNNRFNSIEQTTGSLNTFSGSVNSRLASIELVTGSLNAYTSSVNTRLSAIEINTGSYATTGSNTFKSDQIISGSFIVSGSIFVLSGSISGSHRGDGSGLTGIISSSYAATSSFNTAIFSRGTTYFVSGGMNTTPEDFTIWKTPYPCRVISFQGWADGTGSFINARKSGSGGYSAHTSSLQITNRSTWISSNSVLNTDYGQNDTLQIQITGSTNTSRVTIQLDFIRI